MSDWTELLPEGVVNPIVLEVRHPAAWRADRAADDAAKAKIEALVDDPDYNESLNRMIGAVGADYFTLLTVADESDAERAHVEVHLPKSVEDEERATKIVMKWLKSSELGEVLYGEGRKHGMKPEKVHGKRYGKLRDLRDLKPMKDVKTDIRPKRAKHRARGKAAKPK